MGSGWRACSTCDCRRTILAVRDSFYGCDYRGFLAYIFPPKRAPLGKMGHDCPVWNAKAVLAYALPQKCKPI